MYIKQTSAICFFWKHQPMWQVATPKPSSSDKMYMQFHECRLKAKTVSFRLWLWMMWSYFFYLVAMATIQIVWDCLEWLPNYWCTATIAGRCYPYECKLNSPIIFYLKNNNKTVALRLMALEAPVVSDYSWSITLPPFMSCRDCVWGSHCGCLVVCRHWQAGHSPGGSWRHPHLTPDTCVLPAHWRLPRRLPHPHSSGAC